MSSVMIPCLASVIFACSAHTEITITILSITLNDDVGAQWLSGRLFDSRPGAAGSKINVVVLEQDTFILA